MIWPVRVKNGHVLSPIDLSTYETYLNKFPRDTAIRFEYARYLEQKGYLADAWEQYAQAARDGHLESTIRLKQINLQQGSDRPTFQGQRRRRRRSRIGLLLLLLLLISVLLPLPFLPTFIGTPTWAKSAAPEPPEHTEASELPLLAMKNAVARYQEAIGHLPQTFEELTGAAPNNWLSPIEPDPTRSCPCLVGMPHFELHYFSEVNQLALVRGEEILAVYPVASGPPLPFTRTTISKRVVDPNGGRSAYGSRGLVLQDDFAIHGTNQPALIGKKDITKGCLRMRDEDIEILYTYVSIGTPFEVKKGAPARPTFPQGLPVLSESKPRLDESTPTVVYTWKL